MELGSIVTEMKIHRVKESEEQWSHPEFDMWKERIGKQTEELTDVFPNKS